MAMMKPKLERMASPPLVISPFKMAMTQVNIICPTPPGSLSLHTHLVHPHTEATEGTIEFAYAANFQAPITAEGGIKISNKGDENAPAGTVSGDIEVVGEVFAKSFHVVDFVGNQLSNFFSDGSSSQEGKATFKSGIKMTRGSLEFPDGNKTNNCGRRRQQG